jgi:hypothetical protein
MDLEEKQFLRTLSKRELIEMISDLNDDIHFRTFIPDPKLRAEYGTLSPAEPARRLEICARVRKHWRVLALGVALGKWNVDRIKFVCMQEVMGVVPSDADMDPMLKELTAELEAREKLEEDLGPLRSILLDEK